MKIPRLFMQIRPFAHRGAPQGLLLGLSLPYLSGACPARAQFQPVRVEAALSECPKAPRATP